MHIAFLKKGRQEKRPMTGVLWIAQYIKKNRVKVRKEWWEIN